MTEDQSNSSISLSEIRNARDQAEYLRDQLEAELARIYDDLKSNQHAHTDEKRTNNGIVSMKKAIMAANHAIASIDQALRDIQKSID